MIKVTITGEKGLNQEQGATGFEIYGKDYHNAAFDNLWDDEKAELHEGAGPAALTYEQYRDTGFFMRFFRHNQSDIIFTKYQMSHQWDPTTSVYPHIHFIPMSSGSGTIRFNYAYTWTQPFGEFSGSAGWTSGTIDIAVTPAEQYQHLVRTFSEVPPAPGARESNVLVFKVERDPTNDTYETSKDHETGNANVGILFFDAHYQKIKAGTESQYPENS